MLQKRKRSVELKLSADQWHAVSIPLGRAENPPTRYDGRRNARYDAVVTPMAV